MSDWYCPKCECYLSPEQVTFEERHQTCGTDVIIPNREQTELIQRQDELAELRAGLKEERSKLNAVILGKSAESARLAEQLDKLEAENKRLREQLDKIDRAMKREAE